MNGDIRASVLIGARELRGLLDEPVSAERVRPAVLDVRWALGRTDAHELYLRGHVPGAVFVDLETELAASPSTEGGRHPLPDVAALEEAARRWGVRTGVPVVVYDTSGGMSAARAWWLLRWARAAGVRLLDGGLAAWESAGGVLETGEVVPVRGDVVLVPGALSVLTGDEAAVLASTGILLDARAGERYRGEAEPVDPRAGHIAGALSAPTTENLDADGRFHDSETLRARFAALGVPVRPGVARVGVYCGSGVTAAHEALALAALGVETALYPGSWSQWSADPRRAVTVGPDPR